MKIRQLNVKSCVVVFGDAMLTSALNKPQITHVYTGIDDITVRLSDSFIFVLTIFARPMSVLKYLSIYCITLFPENPQTSTDFMERLQFLLKVSLTILQACGLPRYNCFMATQYMTIDI